MEALEARAPGQALRMRNRLCAIDQCRQETRVGPSCVTGPCGSEPLLSASIYGNASVAAAALILWALLFSGCLLNCSKLLVPQAQ